MLPSAADQLILCATSRLAQSLRWQHDRACVAAGKVRWETLNTSTVARWLAETAEAALLRGEADALLSRRVLDATQEAMLWEKVIEESIPAYAGGFFDVPGMAATAAEANALMVVWGVQPGADDDETQAFLGWRRRFQERCDEKRLIEAARHHEVVLSLIERGAARLPREIRLAGFDNMAPQERRLAQILAAQGVQVGEWTFADSVPETLHVEKLPDPESERRAVAQWAAAWLGRDPQVRLGIVTPNLANVRDALEAALDDALHPALLRPACAESPRAYNFSLGQPLSRQPLVAVALELIHLASGSGEVEQARIGELLRHASWSAGIGEADARARLEAAMREHLGATTTVARTISFAQWFDKGGNRIGQTLAHLSAIEAARRAWGGKALPSQWAPRFRQLLGHAGWPGERRPSSHEFQAREALIEELGRLAALDAIVGTVPASDAARRLAQLCNSHVFQAETIGDPPIQIVGMLEAGGMCFDAVWIMGMTDDAWPPPPRPNPLLPAERQRKVNAPNASAQIQSDFAQSIHRRLLKSAPDITFSFAHADGASELRPSPLLAAVIAVHPSLRAEGEAIHGGKPLDRQRPGGLRDDVPTPAWESLDDNQAPPIAPGEHVRGGTGLLRAQAICPAWAYYRYRLGAKALRQPIEGLDAAARGGIVHEALCAFWQTTASSSALQAMDEAQRQAAIGHAVGAALDEYDRTHRADPLPAIFRTLEGERLRKLLANWLAVELQRGRPFTIVACEERASVDIEGIVCEIRIDRIDRLDDGCEVVIDYKTGNVASYSAWAGTRISDPQLPIYASLARAGAAPTAVAFGRVVLDDARFVGIAAEDGVLPRVPAIESPEARRVFEADAFPDWAAVLQHWRGNIETIAREVKAGLACVRFDDEADLRYCDVLPLLRLAERKAQWEAADD